MKELLIRDNVHSQTENLMSLTIQDIARLAGVSKATVSAVLNGKSGISAKTRQKVLDVVKKLNYRPNQIARSLSSRETKSIGLVIKEIDNPYFAKVMKGVFDKCSQLGYTVLLGSSELSPEQERKCIETLLAQRVDGLILSPLENDEIDLTYLAELMRNQFPLVTLNKVTNIPTDVVEIDNETGAFMAISHLLELGHRYIAFFTGPSHSNPGKVRLEGYRRAFSEKELPIVEKYIIQTGSYIRDGYRKGKELFSIGTDLPTAVFCYNDLVAIGLINSLTELGIPVPDQVSVVGFDDIDFSRSLHIPLTTVRVPAHRIGEKAAELLIEQIQNKSEPVRKKVTLDVELICRKSTAPPPE